MNCDSTEPTRLGQTATAIVSKPADPPPRIVCVTHYFPAKQGGIEIVAYEINRRVATLGHRVDWFASSAEQLPTPIDGLYLHPMSTIHFFERLTGLPLPIWTMGGITQLWSAIRKCDAVHVHDFIYPGSMLAIAFARYWHKQTILTQHIGDIPYKNKILAATLSFMNKTVGRIALLSASQVVYISNAVEAYFRSFIAFRQVPIFLPNGVDTTVFKPADPAQRIAIRSRLGVAADARVCLFVGRFVEKKGMSILGHVVPAMSGITWWFVGRGPLPPPQGNSSEVRIFDGLTHAELAELYRAADLLVLPSCGEGFPLVVQEAFACGLPALVSSETAAGSVEAQNLFFTLSVTGNDVAEQWSATIDRLIKDDITLKGRRTQVAEFAQNNWNWDRTAEDYIRLYRGSEV